MCKNNNKIDLWIINRSQIIIIRKKKLKLFHITNQYHLCNNHNKTYLRVVLIINLNLFLILPKLKLNLLSIILLVYSWVWILSHRQYRISKWILQVLLQIRVVKDQYNLTYSRIWTSVAQSNQSPKQLNSLHLPLTHYLLD
jgi:hypothetical protein